MLNWREYVIDTITISFNTCHSSCKQFKLYKAPYVASFCQFYINIRKYILTETLPGALPLFWGVLEASPLQEGL